MKIPNLICRVPSFMRTTNDTLRLEGWSADAEGEHCTILTSGDWASIRCFSDFTNKTPEEAYGELLAPIRNSDLSLVNMECALGGETPLIKDGPNLRGNPDSAVSLRSAGFDVACLGNNHIMDYGAEGLAVSKELCAEAGLLTTGAGIDREESLKPLIVERNGSRIGIFSLDDREEGDAEWNRAGIGSIFDIHILDRIRSLRAEVDILVLVVHGGKEYVPTPPPYWMEQLLALADCGADLLVGHHPHVPQGITILKRRDGKEVPIVLSTGNFVFRPAAPDNCCTPPRTADGYLVQAAFSGSTLSGVELIPYSIIPEVGPRKLTGEHVDTFQTLLEGLSEPIADRAEREVWFNAWVDHFWTHQFRERVRGLTEKMCAGDTGAMRHARSHHRSPTHLTLIDRALVRMLDGSFGDTPAAVKQKLDGWFAGTWPCAPISLSDEKEALT